MRDSAQEGHDDGEERQAGHWEDGMRCLRCSVREEDLALHLEEQEVRVAMQRQARRQASMSFGARLRGRVRGDDRLHTEQAAGE